MISRAVAKALEKTVVPELRSMVCAFNRVASVLEGFHTSQNELNAPMKFHPNPIEYEPQPQSEPDNDEESQISRGRDLYPYERFIEEQYKDLGKAARKCYNEALKKGNNNPVLAYLFFSKRSVSEKTKSSYIRAYNMAMSELSEFNVSKIKSIFIEEDLEGNYTKSYLKKLWKQVRQIAIICYGMTESTFPVVKFSSKKKGKEHNRVAFSRKYVAEVVQKLEEAKQYEDSLLLHMMWACALRPCEVKYFTFESVTLEDGQCKIRNIQI